MYAALASSPLSSFAGELGQNVGKSVLKSYAAVCLEGTVISGMEGPPPPENRVIDAVLSQEKKKEMEK